MSNMEIEQKYKIDNLESFEKKIKKVGARFVSESKIVDTYFVVKNNPEGRKYLRIRETGAQFELSFSFAHSQTHTEEWETEVKDAETIKEILKQLEFKLDVIVDKTRKTYNYKNSEIVLDRVKNLGDFLEIESISLEELNEIETNLGVRSQDMVMGKGYPDLLRGYLINN